MNTSKASEAMRLFDRCAYCGKALSGRSDKKCCNNSCRTSLAKQRKADANRSKYTRTLTKEFDVALECIEETSIASFNLLIELGYNRVPAKVIAVSTIAVYTAIIVERYNCAVDGDIPLAIAYDYIVSLNAVARKMGIEFTNAIP